MTDDALPAGGPRLTYTGQTKTVVNADYAGMPVGVQIWFVDKTRGKPVGEGTLLEKGGAGTVSVAIHHSMSSGEYSLAAQGPDGNEIAQTVEFYIDNGD
jgi:hypothetical protein